jgi:ribosomal protein L6P/L9E
MRFKGKIYKVKRTKKKKLKLSFGRSHKTIVVLKNLFLKKRRKQKHKFLLISSSKYDIVQPAALIKSVRSINMFTQRGLRLSRQIIYKKVGKKSSYLNKK